MTPINSPDSMLNLAAVPPRRTAGWLAFIFTTLASSLLAATATTFPSLTPSLSPSDGERVAEGRVRGLMNQSRVAGPAHLQPIQAAKLNTTPRGFIPNLGQVQDNVVKFALRDNGVSAYFTDRGFVLWNGQSTTIPQDGSEIKVPVAPRWSLIGGQPVEPVGGETFAHTVSFFRGNDPAKWHANVPAYRDLRYPEILKGVELRVESREHGFEYTFHVQPQAKPKLRFRYDGVTALEKSLAGDLIVRTAKGHFTESRPIAFQWIDGTKRDVASSFEIVSANEYRIAVGPYDERHELVIDPVLDWSTFLGGSHFDGLDNVKIDPNGNICVAGNTYSMDLPDNAGFSTGAGVNSYDTYVAKFSQDGTQLLWLGYLGGAGATDEHVWNRGLAVDSAGNVYMSGYTESVDFPVTAGAFQENHGGGDWDAFVTKIRFDGASIVWSSFVGGADVDWNEGIVLDPQENVLLAGLTFSSDFPVLNASDATLGGASDAFVTKFDAAGALQWSTYLGGSGNADRAAGLVANAAGEIFVFGDTDSPDMATAGDTTLGGANDAFVTKLGADGTHAWTTLIGGSGVENDGSLTLNSRGSIVLDSAGDVLVCGETGSTDFPVTAGAFDLASNGGMDGYVAKLAGSDASVIWASYLGGQYQDRPWSIAVNPWDEIFLIGRTDSPNFPVTPDAVQTSFQGGLQDGFLTKLSADGSSLLYSTFLGGSQAQDVALALTYDSGNVFVAGWASSASYPTTAGAYQTGCSSCGVGWADGVVLKFLDAFLAHDGFESGNYSGGVGWTGSWTISGDVSILTSSGQHSGSRHVRLRRGTGMLTRTVDLPPGTLTLELGFWTKIHSFEGTESAVVRINGSATPVATFTSADSDNTYRYVEVDLTSYIASQIQITFDANMGDNGDNWYLDDIRLTGTSAPVPPVADAGPDQVITADLSGFATVTLNGSGFDPDGGAVSFAWTEGATVLGTGVSISPSLSVGPHTITLTVTDDEGAIATDYVQITVNPALPPPANPMHCGDLDGSSAVQSGSKWKATVVVTMHVGNESPVAGASVSIQWSTGATATATTDANGQCTFTLSNLSRQGTPSVTLTIANATHTSLIYTATANHDPEGDSTGTSITVNKP